MSTAAGRPARHSLPGPVVIKPPVSCADEELDAFERLLRRSGEVVERGLSIRVRAAACLGFTYSGQGELTAIAALKVPFPSYRDRVFRKSGTRRPAVAYGLELGWFFVRPSHRGRRLARDLAAGLLARAPDRAVFATTRTDNLPMLRVLESLGFQPAGDPYFKDTAGGRDRLLLLVRPARRNGP